MAGLLLIRATHLQGNATAAPAEEGPHVHTTMLSGTNVEREVSRAQQRRAGQRAETGFTGREEGDRRRKRLHNAPVAQTVGALAGSLAPQHTIATLALSPAC